jgi:uncharacterized protein YdeI (YjbR/CyaY-like superfamily)
VSKQELLTFISRSEWRSWLQKNHGRTKEAWLVHYKKTSGRCNITYDEAVEEALCFGWIDGKKKTIDQERYAFRFTPRGAHSAWSALNIRRAKSLIRAGKMTGAGLNAFQNHKQRRVPPLPEELPAKLAETFKSDTTAWQNFLAFPPGYQRLCVGWVASAKREETQLRRLSMLMEHSAAKTKISFM